MSPNAPSPFGQQSIGSYDGFDTVVSVDLTRSEVNDPFEGQHVAGHEISHLFQNFFTLQGLSYYSIVQMIESLTEDLLLAWQAPIPIPVLGWLDSDSPALKGDRSSAFYYDRYFRLFAQLGSSHRSPRQASDWAQNATSDDILRALQGKTFRIDTDSGFFEVDGRNAFEIDYSAICESMAKSMEHFGTAATIAKLGTGGTPDPQAISGAMERLHNAAGREMASPGLINYTFSLLYLRQSGYDLSEAIHLTIILSYIALMSALPAPSLPELGTGRIVDTGGRASRVYANLLVNAYEDKYLPLLNRIGTPGAFATVVDYLDQLVEIGGGPSMSEAHEVMRKFIAVRQSHMREQRLPRNLWPQRILDSVGRYSQRLSSVPFVQGLQLLMSPYRFLHESNVGPAIVCRDGVVYPMANADSVACEIATFSASRNFVKTLLFGWNRLETFHEGADSAREAFVKYLDQFGVSLRDPAPETLLDSD